jgi:hypothetical protein
MTSQQKLKHKTIFAKVLTEMEQRLRASMIRSVKNSSPQ